MKYRMVVKPLSEWCKVITAWMPRGKALVCVCSRVNRIRWNGGGIAFHYKSLMVCVAAA
jgi:hypothetical protein